MSPHKIQKLTNGITLITVPVKGTMATTVLAMFPVGSRYETKKVSGAAHFLEHMLFKGTEKRPTAQDISRALEAYGAEYNAFTNKDYTGYYVKIDGNRQEVAFDMLSDMLYHSKLEEVEVEKEKGAIVEELRMYRDNPMMAVDQLFDNVLFGDSPMGWDVGGTEQTVRGISRDDLQNFYETHYSPKNMTLIVAGNISSRLKQYLKFFTNKVAPKKAKGPTYYKNNFVKVTWNKKNLPLAERVVVEKRVADQAQVVMGFPSLKYGDKERYAQTILMTVLGSGMSSRLFVEVRERRGLAYMVHGGTAAYRDSGVAYIQAGLDPARFKEAIDVIKLELLRICNEPITNDELRDAKTSIAGAMALSLENSRAQADWYAKQAIFSKKVESPSEVMKNLEKVTAKQVQKLAQRIFKNEEMRMAVISSMDRTEVLKALI